MDRAARVSNLVFHWIWVNEQTLMDEPVYRRIRLADMRLAVVAAILLAEGVKDEASWQLVHAALPRMGLGDQALIRRQAHFAEFLRRQFSWGRRKPLPAEKRGR